MLALAAAQLAHDSSEHPDFYPPRLVRQSDEERLTVVIDTDGTEYGVASDGSVYCLADGEVDEIATCEAGALYVRAEAYLPLVVLAQVLREHGHIVTRRAK